MDTATWLIKRLEEAQGQSPMYALLPSDGTHGIVIGEADEVLAVYRRLARFVEDGQTDGDVSDLDEQIGAKWLTAREAANEFGVAYSSITWACNRGKIRAARRDGPRGVWEFPQRTFLYWLKTRRATVERE